MTSIKNFMVTLNLCTLRSLKIYGPFTVRRPYLVSDRLNVKSHLPLWPPQLTIDILRLILNSPVHSPTDSPDSVVWVRILNPPVLFLSPPIYTLSDIPVYTVFDCWSTYGVHLRYFLSYYLLEKSIPFRHLSLQMWTLFFSLCSLLNLYPSCITSTLHSIYTDISDVILYAQHFYTLWPFLFPNNLIIFLSILPTFNPM